VSDNRLGHVANDLDALGKLVLVILALASAGRRIGQTVTDGDTLEQGSI